jgi:hypothetical protein
MPSSVTPSKVVKKVAKKVVIKLPKNCQRGVKKLSKVVKKLPKSEMPRKIRFKKTKKN